MVLTTATILALLLLEAAAPAPPAPPKHSGSFFGTPPVVFPHAARPARAPATLPPPAPRPDTTLGDRLRRDELAASGPRAAGEASLRSGAYHYARGEYRAAAESYARAAARLDPARKSEALYWQGLSYLGLGSTNAARAALEEVVESGSPRRADALLGIAAAWEDEGQPDKAYDALGKLLDGDPGEAGAAALERTAALADRLRKPGDAERARTRLIAAYPASMEAAMASAALKNAAAPTAGGSIALEAGRFASSSRAKALATRATRAGFAGARVIERGSGAAKSYVVVLGNWADRDAAREAQARAAKELGLSARMTGPK